MAEGWERDYEEHLKKADRAFGGELRKQRRRQRRRRVLRQARRVGGVAVLLVGLGGIAFVFRGVYFGDRSGRTATGVLTADVGASTTSSTEPDHRLERRHYDMGDCVYWDDRSQAETYLLDTRVVPCEEPHVLEVTGRETLKDRGPYPDDAFWDAFFDTGPCLTHAEEYLHGRLDPHGRFYSHGVMPSPESWADGDREVYCGIGRSSDVQAEIDLPGNALSTGRVQRADQYRVYAIGSCIAPDGEGLATGTAPCDGPHVVEISGHVDLTGRTDTLPADDRYDSLVGKECERLGRAYAKGNFKDPVRGGWLLIEPASWDAGRRTVECTVAEYRNDEAATITRHLGA